MAFLALGEVTRTSPSSSEESQPSESASSSFDGFDYNYASADTSFNNALFNISFFISQNACSTYFPTLVRSI
jgi:hypothetical protein